MTTIAWIFARGGSKGLLKKNLRTVAGKPLLVHAIEHAQAATLVDRVIVSTEDLEIAAVALGAGAGLIDRPAELATDTAPEWLAWQHAVREYQRHFEPDMDVFVSVPCTSPLRLPEDIDNCIRALTENDADAVITVTPCHRNPYYNMIVLSPDGYADRVCSTLDDWPQRRQDCPLVYDVTTVAYAARPEFVLKASGLWEGRVRALVVPPERALDIDTEDDLFDAECNWYRLNGYRPVWQKESRRR